MSQITTKWIADNAVTNQKISHVDTYTMGGANINGRLGIDTTSPADQIHVYSTSGPTVIRLDQSAAAHPYRLSTDTAGKLNIIDNVSVTGVDTTHVSISSSASGVRVGLDSTNPRDKLHIRTNSATGEAAVRLDTDDGGSGRPYRMVSGNDGVFKIIDAVTDQTRVSVSGVSGFIVTGDATITGNLSVSGTLDVDATVVGDFRVTRDATVGNTLSVPTRSILGNLTLTKLGSDSIISSPGVLRMTPGGDTQIISGGDLTLNAAYSIGMESALGDINLSAPSGNINLTPIAALTVASSNLNVNTAGDTTVTGGLVAKDLYAIDAAGFPRVTLDGNGGASIYFSDLGAPRQIISWDEASTSLRIGHDTGYPTYVTSSNFLVSRAGDATFTGGMNVSRDTQFSGVGGFRVNKTLSIDLLSSAGSLNLTALGGDLKVTCQNTLISSEIIQLTANGLGGYCGIEALVGIGCTDPSSQLDVDSTSIRIRTSTTKTASNPGVPGEIVWDANYIYVCTATNTWKRAGITGGY